MIKYEVIIYWSKKTRYLSRVPNFRDVRDGATYREALANVEVISRRDGDCEGNGPAHS
jgi:predicted RNase H-like HicB family nuclease